MPLARNDRLQHNVNSFAITERNLMTSNKKNSPVKTLNGTSKRRGRRRKEIAEAEDKGLTKEQLEKRNRRRDNNRVAAAKLRQKKRDEMETLKWVCLYWSLSLNFLCSLEAAQHK
ncbi:unnamed protein product [Toxocara canis]|uniref:BZIP domain-containing protein n=1 Tax=Toxocara canis TaxID=6265 RepID=A0A183U4T2_TOXCA|nr:unnamed protein product [Toxocara canis]